MGQIEDGCSVGVMEEVMEEVAPPPMSKVVLINDNYTPFDFVVEVLMEVFRKDEQSAFALAVKVHEDGSAVVETLPHDIAKMKQRKVMEIASESQHPLVVVVEPESPSRKLGMGR